MVADEVRKLAERTAKATTEISTLVGRIQEETGHAKSIMDIGAEDAASYSAESEGAMRSMQHLLSLSQQMQQSISSSARLANAELANIEELTLKLEVYKVLLGLSELQPNDLPDETQCRLGRWYYVGEGKTEFSRLPGLPGNGSPTPGRTRSGPTRRGMLSQPRLARRTGSPDPNGGSESDRDCLSMERILAASTERSG
nr:CZB domain-containing protein [Paludibacterium denitrificans]